MAYVEVRKNGNIIKRREVDEQKARKGCKLRFGSAGDVFLTIGKTETVGDFTIQMFAGDIPQTDPESKNKQSGQIQQTESKLPLDFSASSRPSTKEQNTDKKPEIEGYKIIEKLGRGGMGIVWLAEQLSTKRKVALKLLISHASDSKKAKAKFQREVELTARLDHPNIASIYDSGLHHGMYYYAMEYIDGEPLDKYVKYHNLTRKPILRLMYKICIAVLYAHQRAVIHRDLKPSNIMVDEEGQPHILDFGLAKALLDDDSVAVSMEGQIAGTPAYMSPEQASGVHSDIDTRTDVFSLGVILYELLTGQSPHDLSGSMLDVLHNITEGNITRPSQVSKKIDIELEAIILKALAVNPDERYASAGMLAMDIKNYLEGEPLDALVPTTLYFLRKKALKHKKQVGITASVLFIIFVIIFVAYTKVIDERAVNRIIQDRNEQLTEEIADLRTQILTGTSEQAEAALSALEEKYLIEKGNVERLQQELIAAQNQNGMTVENAKPDTGFDFDKSLNMGEPINSQYLDASISFSSNGLEMFFCSNRPGGSGEEDIWTSRRESNQGTWNIPINLGSKINSSSKDFMVHLSPDDLTLFFTSDRNGGHGDTDIYIIERETINGTWSEPRNLGQIVNSNKNDSEPIISADGLELYFSSDRNGGYGGPDIWISKRETTQDSWEPPVNIGPVINTSSGEYMPYISNNGLILLFSSNRTGGFGNRDIYICRRSALDQPWTKPLNLGPVINSGQADDLPYLSPDNSILYFNSNRNGGFGSRDIWKVPIIPNIDFNFGKLVNLGEPINTSSIEKSPYISSDGLSLYFTSNREGSINDSEDIWISTRDSIDAPWGTPQNMGNRINSSSSDLMLLVGPVYDILSFSSDRPDRNGNFNLYTSRRDSPKNPWGEPTIFDLNNNTKNPKLNPLLYLGTRLYFNSYNHNGYGSQDIWFAQRPNIQQDWEYPTNEGDLININEIISNEEMPYLPLDSRFLLFVSDRPGGFGKKDIYISRRNSNNEPWGEPINLGPEVNSSEDDEYPRICMNDSILIFSSTREGGSGDSDLWQIPIIQNNAFTLTEAVKVDSIIDTPSGDWGYAITSDGLEQYFASNQPDGLGGNDIYISKRTSINDAWSQPENLGQIINTDYNDAAVFISSDDLTLYFSSDRFGSMDIWMSTRTTREDDWTTPINLGETINTPYHDGSPYLSGDSLTIYFDSNRPNPNGDNNSDIWCAKRATPDSPWNEPENLGPVINTPENEADPAITKDGISLIFASNRNGTIGNGDLWLSRRINTSGQWQEPINLGPKINRPRNDAEPFLSEIDSTLFLTSNRGNSGEYNLWQTTITQNPDLNRDGTINIEDLVILIENWGKTMSHADIAPSPFGNGKVDEQDLKLLLQKME